MIDVEYYLLKNPPRRTQFYPTRVAPWRGGIGVHSTESIADLQPPDNGAENTANYIRIRTDAGSYVWLSDSNGTVWLVPYTYTTFSIKTAGFNSSTVSGALACRTVDLDVNDEWTQKAMRYFAECCVAVWRDAGFDPIKGARWITGKQALAGEQGLFLHGDVQSDRSDAFAKHPQRDELEALLVTLIIEIAGGSTPPPPTEWSSADMNIATDPTTGLKTEIRTNRDGVVRIRWESKPGIWGKTVKLTDVQQPTDPNLKFDQAEIRWEKDRFVIHAASSAFENEFWTQQDLARPDRKWTPWGEF